MTDQTLGWRTDERIARLRDEAHRRRLANHASTRPVDGWTRIGRYLATRLGRRTKRLATARA
jgi:hypothetical protein